MPPGVQAYTAVCVNMAILHDFRPDVLACSSFSYEAPFYMPTKFSEEEIADYLLAGYDMIKEARYRMLVAHCPSYQTAIDRIHPGSHVGTVPVYALLLKPISLPSVSLSTFMRH